VIRRRRGKNSHQLVAVVGISFHYGLGLFLEDPPSRRDLAFQRRLQLAMA
jgi:hypothetical protein